MASKKTTTKAARNKPRTRSAARKTTGRQAGSAAGKSPRKRKAAAGTATSPRARSRKPAPAGTRRAVRRLTKRQVDRFRQTLLGLRQKVQGHITFLVDDSLNRPGYDVPDDNGDDFERESALNFVQSERDVLIEIDEALRRLDEGSYGICVDCSKPIEAPRLEALPFTQMCITCKSNAEKGKHPFRRLVPASQSLAGRKPDTGVAEEETDEE